MRFVPVAPRPALTASYGLEQETEGLLERIVGEVEE